MALPLLSGRRQALQADKLTNNAPKRHGAPPPHPAAGRLVAEQPGDAGEGKAAGKGGPPSGAVASGRIRMKPSDQGREQAPPVEEGASPAQEHTPITQAPTPVQGLGRDSGSKGQCKACQTQTAEPNTTEGPGRCMTRLACHISGRRREVPAT